MGKPVVASLELIFSIRWMPLRGRCRKSPASTRGRSLMRRPRVGAGHHGFHGVEPNRPAGAMCGLHANAGSRKTAPVHRRKHKDRH